VNNKILLNCALLGIIICVLAVAPINHSAKSQLNTRPLPVILIHGYIEIASIWTRWQQLLQNDGIQAFPVTFKQSNDSCGSAIDHAQELAQIVKQVKSVTGQDKVNIVGHSKGGLDARVYLNNNISSSDVSNLIMIGTPNAGDPLADIYSASDPCKPAVYDLETNALDTMAQRNSNTQYYTIAGDWTPYGMYDCLQDEAGYNYYYFYQAFESNDGIVSVTSVESQPYFTHLGYSPNCHQNLAGDIEYQLARNVLLGRP